MADNSLSYLTKCVVRMADDYQVSINKNVKDIRDAICGGKIDKVITSLVEGTSSKGGKVDIKSLKGVSLDNRGVRKESSETNKLLGKILNKIGGRRKGFDETDEKINFKRNKKGKDFSTIMDTAGLVERLKGISLKDLINSKRKMKPLEKITKKALNIFHMFKNEKEIKDVMSFMDKTIDISKKLKKVALSSILSDKGVKTIEKIFFGKGKRGGIVSIMERVNAKHVAIEGGKRGIGSIHKATLSVLGLCLTTIGIGILAIPAAAGITITSLLVTGLTVMFEKTGRKLRGIRKGAETFAIMSGGLAIFSLGMLALIKSTKDLTWKQSGIMIASMTGVGLAMAGMGLLSAPIALGAGVMVLLGASLGILGLSLVAWKDFDPGKPMKNIKDTVHGLRTTFGLEKERKEGEPEPGFFKKMGMGIGAGLEGLCGAIGGVGQFVEMGMLAAGVMAMDAIRLALIPWVKDVDLKPAVDNVVTNIGILKNAFFPQVTQKGEKGALWKNIGNKLGKGLEGLCGAIGGIGEFAEITGIATGILAMDTIRLTLLPWKDEVDLKPAVDNVVKNMKYLKETFFHPVAEKGEKGALWKNIGNKLGKGLEGLCGAIGGIGEFAEITAISVAILSMDALRLTLLPWKDYDSKPQVDNMKSLMTGLKSVFNDDKSFTTIDTNVLKKNTSILTGFFKDLRKNPLNTEIISTPLERSVKAINSIDIEKATVMSDLFTSFRRLNKASLFNGFGTSVDKFVEACKGFMKGVNDFSNKPMEQSVETENAREVREVQSVNEGGITINNTQQLAEAIAEAMRNLNIRINPNMIDVNLVANSSSGKKVTLSILD